MSDSSSRGEGGRPQDKGGENEGISGRVRHFAHSIGETVSDLAAGYSISAGILVESKTAEKLHFDLLTYQELKWSFNLGIFLKRRLNTDNLNSPLKCNSKSNKDICSSFYSIRGLQYN